MTHPLYLKEEWRRTQPDLLVYIPQTLEGPDAANQHFNVVATPTGAFLAFWTTGTLESAHDQRVVCSPLPTGARRGRKEPQAIDVPQPGDPPGAGLASWEFPIVAKGMLPSGGTRIWCFYTKNTAIVDGGPKIITFVVDGALCDGGDFRQFGWGRYNPNLRGVKGTDTLRIGSSLQGRVRSLRIYDRYLRTSEAIGNYRAGMGG